MRPHLRMAGRVLAYTVFGLGAIYWVLSLVGLRIVFGDGELHLEAAQLWLTGGDPWSASSTEHFHFAAPPTALLPFIPFALLGPFGLAAWMAVTAAAAVILQRRYGLEPMWLLFPPLVQGVLLGNPIVVGVALLATRFAWVAPLLRAQLSVALVERPRQLGAAAVVGALTVPLLPWRAFLDQLPTIAARYAQEGGNASAWGTVLFVPTAVALVVLVVVDRPAAVWLALPALAPQSGFYTSILAMPLRSLWLGAVLAVPVAGAPAVGTILYAGWRLVERGRTGRSRGPDPA